MKNEITPHKIALERLKKGDGKVSVDAVHYYYESEVLRQENRVMQFRIIKKAAAGSDTWATSEQKKIAKIAAPFDKLTGADFKKLRASGKRKPKSM